MEYGAGMFWGHSGNALLMWMIIMAEMATTVIITVHEDDVEGDNNKDAMMNQGRRIGRGEGGVLIFLSIGPVSFNSSLFETKIHVSKDRMIYSIFTSLAISYLGVRFIHAIESKSKLGTPRLLSLSN